MELMKKNASLTAQEISKNINLDRSTVQKAVKELSKKELIEKHQINFTKGGYSFIYSVKSKNHIKEEINEIIDKWNKAVRKHIEEW